MRSYEVLIEVADLLIVCYYIHFSNLPLKMAFVHVNSTWRLVVFFVNLKLAPTAA